MHACVYIYICNTYAIAYLCVLIWNKIDMNQLVNRVRLCFPASSSRVSGWGHV